MKANEAVSVQFTVGKIDAGIAILLSPENHIIEFPSSILPDKVHVGSILNLTLERNKEEETKEYESFEALQDEIYQEYAIAPETPCLSAKRVTQTSVLLRWDPLVLYSSSFRGIDVYRNGVKLSLKPSLSVNQIKLTGLSVNTTYEIYIVLATSAGQFPSNKIQVTTHAMENLSGIYPCFGAFSNDAEIDLLIELLSRVGGIFGFDK